MSSRRPVACPEDVEIPVIHGAQNALGLLLPVKPEAGMDRADRVVEFTQEVVRIVERSIRQNIHFGGFQDAETAQACVELVDVFDLRPQILDRNAARDLEALGMIGDADILVAALSRRLRHVLDGIAAVARRRMRVKLAPDVLRRHQHGQGVLRGTLDFVVSFAQFRFDILQAEFSVESLLGREGRLSSPRKAPVTAVSFFRCAFEPVQATICRPQSFLPASWMRSRTPEESAKTALSFPEETSGVRPP